MADNEASLAAFRAFAEVWAEGEFLASRGAYAVTEAPLTPSDEGAAERADSCVDAETVGPLGASRRAVGPLR